MILRAHDLGELFEKSTAAFADRPLFGVKESGRWRWQTYGEFRAEVDHLRSGLAQLGLGTEDRIAIISNNRIEWAAAAYATYGLGATFVPMYEEQLAREWCAILQDSGARAVFVAGEEIAWTLERMRAELPQLQHIIGIERAPDDPYSYHNLIERGRYAPVAVRRSDPDAIAALIYTSGTTGRPKGVMLSHGNITSNLSDVFDLFDLGQGDRTLSFLPWAHAYGQTCELHGMFAVGCEIAINDALPNLVDNLREVKPTILIAVPRVFNKLYASMMKQIDAKPYPVRALVRAGIQAAVRRAHGEAAGPFGRLTSALDERLVFSKLRERLGGRLRYAISGSASLSVEVAELIDAVGIAVYEGYGLTEASPIVSVNAPGHRKLGSAGRVVPGVRVEIRDGEIVVYGPNVMKGYHQRPEETALALTPDGGLRTGDLGHLDDDGYLFITGRIKEQYKLENGKYVMPSPLEEALKLSPFITNVMLYGANRPFNVALVVPDRAAVEAWAKAQGHTLGELASDEAVRALIMHELRSRANEMKAFEVPKACVITLDDFTIDNGLLTPTLKLKRAAIADKYAAELELAYQRTLAAAA